MQFYNNKLKRLSRYLRKNTTDAEKLLWSKIRRKLLKGYQFYRQRIISNYIVDFYCPKVKLVVELDGGQHYTDNGKSKDNIRDEYMRSLKLKVLRFSDIEVLKNINGVVERITENL